VAERTAELNATNVELARAARLKDEFLAAMSHELRTPLSAVLGMTEALREEVFGTLNDRQIGALRTIEESGRHLLTLINDILDLSKIEAGKVELEPASVYIQHLSAQFTVCSTNGFEKANTNILNARQQSRDNSSR
jgi:signal transduction histidine kinase